MLYVSQRSTLLAQSTRCPIAAEPTHLDEALARLSEEDHLAAELVKMRYFAGLTLAQTAEALGVSPRTADRCWAYAKAWLYHELANGESRPAGEASEP